MEFVQHVQATPGMHHGEKSLFQTSGGAAPGLLASWTTAAIE
jgi:hypothetical protein